MTQRIAGMFVLATLWTASGCAALEAAQQDRIDHAVSVSSAEPLYTYQRVGFERMRCQGQRCRGVQAEQLEGALRKALTDVCYQVVDAAEMERYADHYANAWGELGMGMSFDFRGPEGMMVEFTTLAPDLRDTLVEELGLEGVIKSSLSIGKPDEITDFRTATVDVQLIDARHRHTVWQARLSGHVDDDSMQPSLEQLMGEIALAIRRRAAACGAPPVATDLTVVEDRLKLPGRVFFELGSARLSPRSSSLLDDVATWIEANRDVTMVVIEGHTDDAGDDVSNLRLSEGRAKAVKDYLVSRGIDAARLDAQGFGEAKPIVPNDSAANRARNRRVELRIFR